MSTSPSTPRLSEAARHLVIPEGIVTSLYPRVQRRLDAMRVAFDPWQEGAATVALGCRKDGKFTATVDGVVWSIPRQVGKTFTVGNLLIALALELPGLRIVWTSHHGRTTTNTFRSMQGMVRRPVVWRTVEAVRTANGEQEIRFANGSIIMFGAREQGFGRGMDAVDVLVFDEAQILDLKALEDMVPATNQARNPHGGLVFLIGTPPRPVDNGEAFTAKRQQALKGESRGIFYVEMGADPAADLDDREQWARANPSFPLRTPVESMLRMRSLIPDDDSWRREALGVWDAVSATRVIDEQTWNLVAAPASMPIERLTLAVDVTPDRSSAAISLAGRRPDGLWHVELDEHRKGADWTIGWVKQRAERNRLHAVVVDELAGLTEKRHGRHFLKGTDIAVTLAAAEGRDMAMAWATFHDAVTSATVRHTDQPQVNVALSQAGTRDLQGGKALSKKTSTSDITPLTSQTLALWGAQRDDMNRPQRKRTDGRRAVIL